MIVRAGSNFPDKEGYIYQVKTIIRHPRYNEDVADEFDVALLRLNNSIRFTPCNKVSIDLPEAGKDVPAGSFLSVTGWGATEVCCVKYIIINLRSSQGDIVNS